MEDALLPYTELTSVDFNSIIKRDVTPITVDDLSDGNIAEFILFLKYYYDLRSDL